MIYAAGGIPESIDYSWSDSPTGPWTYKGVIMPKSEPGAAFTVHSGIVDFKGRSFFFYHNQKNVKGGGFSRSTAIEEFTWNADGTIPTIRATNNGVVKPIKNLDPIKSMVPQGEKTAKVHWGVDEGWVEHHNTDLWNRTAPIDGAWRWAT